MASKTTAQQRFERGIFYLHTAYDELLPVVRQAHPDAGCLPLPPIAVPSTIAGIRPQLDMVYANLFDPERHGVNRVWIAAWDRCPHLDRERAIDLKELYYRWYQLLGGLEYCTRPQRGARSLSELADRYSQFFFWLNKFRGIYPPDARITWDGKVTWTRQKSSPRSDPGDRPSRATDGGGPAATRRGGSSRSTSLASGRTPLSGRTGADAGAHGGGGGARVHADGARGVGVTGPVPGMTGCQSRVETDPPAAGKPPRQNILG